MNTTTFLEHKQTKRIEIVNNKGWGDFLFCWDEVHGEPANEIERLNFS